MSSLPNEKPGATATAKNVGSATAKVVVYIIIYVIVSAIVKYIFEGLLPSETVKYLISDHRN